MTTPTDREEIIWRINVFRDEDGCAADYRTEDGREGGMGEYSTTPIGALAELCAALIKIAEDKLTMDKE
ncbi:MAG: hypothetical protein IT434_09580 [Phycisphaerales bacterium]|nr:hypothetical protein [Phycisphaerales bacterium]